MSWSQGDKAALDSLVEPGPDEVVDAEPPDEAPDGSRPPVAAWRRWAAVGIAVVLVAGAAVALATRDRNDGTAAPQPTTASTTAATRTPADPTKPPPLLNTGDDFDTIVRSSLAFEDWVNQYDPDPKWVDATVAPENTDQYGYEWNKQNLANLKAAGQHYDGPGIRVRKVIVRERVTDVQVAVYIIYESLPVHIVDSSGKIVSTEPTLPPTGFLVDWVRGDDGRWRQYHLQVLGPPAPELLR